MRRLWTQARLSMEVRRNKAIKTLFIPSHLMPLIHPENTIVTIHDAAFKHDPESYGLMSRLYLDWGARFAVRHARSIITPSIVSKEDLINFYGADSARVHVIPLGFEPPPQFSEPVEEQMILDQFALANAPYLFYIGRVERKKNTDTLLKAFELFHKKHPEVKLVLAGFFGRGGDEIVRQIPDSVRESVILTGYIDEIIKSVLFKNAKGFVFPSRYEGFGLPLLEAMYYRLPIIASDIPTSREIAGNRAMYFPTENFEALSDLFVRLIKQPLNLSELSAHYKEILDRYTWMNCARKTLEVLNS
jgi:glycosyltransferase involved in cell wall biosynthesis